MVHGEVAQHAGFDLYLLGVDLPLDFVARLQFLLGHDAQALEHLDALLVEIALEDDGAGSLGVEPALGGFGLPLVAVAVAVETDGLADLDVLAKDVDDGVVLGRMAGALGILCPARVLEYLRVDAPLEVDKCLGDGAVEGNHGAGTVGFASHSAKLETVAREGEGAGAVAVGVVDEQLGYLGDVELHALLAVHREEVFLVGFLDVVEQLGELFAEERADDGGGCLVGSQTMGVGGAHDAGLQQPVVAIDAHEGLDDECGEAEVLLGCLAGGVEEDARVGGEAPVVVLARTVDAGKGFFVEEGAEAVLAGHALHERHEQHVVVDGEVGVLEDGCQLKLVGGHLVVARLHRDAEHEGVYLQIAHEGCHTLGDAAEIVVVHLLVLGGVVSHEGAACEQKVGAGSIEAFVDKEVLLLPSEIARHLFHLGVEVVTDVGGCHVDGFQGSQERRLIVERLAAVGDEDGGDDECVVDDEDGAGGVPCGVAACLEGAAYAAAGERRGVGLLLDEQLAAELLNHASLAVVLDERVVLLGGAFGQRLEPMGVVCDAVLLGPLHHAGSHLVGYLAVELCAFVDDVYHLVVHTLRQILVHLLAVEDILAEVFARSFTRCFYVEGLLLECLAYNLKSQFVSHNCV